MKSAFTSERARTELVRLLRRLYCGHITNDQFEDAALLLIRHDRAAAEVYNLGARCSYSDNREYRLIGRDALSREERREVARWMLFLKSDRDYLWPAWRHFSSRFSLSILCAASVAGELWHGWSGALVAFLFALWPLAYGDNLYGRKTWERTGKADDRAVWPFISKADYEAALKNPPYLFGARRS